MFHHIKEKIEEKIGHTHFQEKAIEAVSVGIHLAKPLICERMKTGLAKAGCEVAMDIVESLFDSIIEAKSEEQESVSTDE